MTPLPHRRGTYVLLGRLAAPTTIIVGRLGRIDFPAGHYAYVGSAFGPGGIAARARHHLAVSDHPHWHLDYLRPHLTPRALWFTTAPRPLEHLWTAALLGIRGAQTPCPGFGSSDCGCPSHLIGFRRMPALATFRKHLRRRGEGGVRGLQLDGTATEGLR